MWINGKVTGIDWCDVQTSGGKACGTQVNASNAAYNDSTAVLTGTWGPTQTAQATVVAGTLGASSVEEVELRLRTNIEPHSIIGYEFDFRNVVNGGYIQIVRWNGPINNFTIISSSNNNYHGIKSGDVIKATAVGSTLTAYVNGIIVSQATDSFYSNGTPGVGFWNAGGSNGIFSKRQRIHPNPDAQSDTNSNTCPYPDPDS